MTFRVPVVFWSYCRDFTGTEREEFELRDGATVGELLEQVYARFGKLGEARRSLLVAVGVEYAEPGRRLERGEEVSLFPPVQGG
ncbi:MAG: MoaD/ThiS family protein [Verrucomicrobia bacterium]|nr:MoaD/ThiS family protein [Verrucomicrobiota bacterium]